MRLKWMGLVLVLSMIGNVANAFSIIMPLPLKNMEISGQALSAGKPVAGTTVQAYFYNCDTKAQAKAVTNQNGYYRLVIPSYPRVIVVNRLATPTELKERAKLNISPPAIITDLRPIPVFVGAQSTTAPLSICMQALQGGQNTALKNRFNLTIPNDTLKPLTPPTPPKTLTPPKPNEQQKCQAQGGKWESLSRGVVGCNLSYKDAGRLCTDGKQCSSQLCLAKDRNPRAVEGFCAANTAAIINGCLGEIKRGHWRSRPCP